MEERVNIAELLRDCPKGMELDCVMYDNVKFDYVLEGHSSPIKVDSPAGQISLDKYGCYSNNKQAKCVIFPKGKTTWEGFIPPRVFKNGDIIFTRTFDSTWVSIFKQFSEDRCCTYIDLCIDDNYIYNTWGVCHKEEITEQRLATEKEKLKLFDAISAYNYESNKEAKTLEKLPKFKVGDWVVNIDEKVNQVVAIDDNCDGFTLDDGSHCNNAWNKLYRLWTIQDAKEGDVLCDYIEEYNNPLIFILKKFEHVNFGLVKPSDYSSYCFLSAGDKQRFEEGTYHHKHNIKPATKEQRDLLFQKMKESGYKWNEGTKTPEKLIVPKFKVGDRIKTIYKNYQYVIKEITDTHYTLEEVEDKFQYTEPIIEDKNWELVSDNFDITTLVPFESRVLVRDTKTCVWRPAIWGCCVGTDFYVLNGTYWKQCIPYEGNEHLMGKKDNCADYYKTWK